MNASWRDQQHERSFRWDSVMVHRLRAGKRTHHLHVVAAPSPLVARYLVFRDYLRAHPDEALRYATFKQNLAAQHAHERDGYVDAKPPFVDAMIERAWQWRPLT